ncbi:MAG: DUF3899 domain-containing protein [Lachnospiraceae bacterium]|jgi:hypothetical protein|nr:DUF3899 domain-containing protein [Lachnospiraceae bacterium]
MKNEPPRTFPTATADATRAFASALARGAIPAAASSAATLGASALVLLLRRDPINCAAISDGLFLWGLAFLCVGACLRILRSGFFDVFQKSMKLWAPHRKPAGTASGAGMPSESTTDAAGKKPCAPASGVAASNQRTIREDTTAETTFETAGSTAAETTFKTPKDPRPDDLGETANLSDTMGRGSDAYWFLTAAICIAASVALLLVQAQ